jgi:hypothetical protein
MARKPVPPPPQVPRPPPPAPPPPQPSPMTAAPEPVKDKFWLGLVWGGIIVAALSMAIASTTYLIIGEVCP